jgi:hypothetical protein
MADVETPAAASSPAAEPQQAQPTKTEETVSVPTNAEDYAEWRASGKLPERRTPSKGEASAAPKKHSVDSDKPSESTAPVSETGDVRQGNVQKRIDKVIAERETFRRENEALKAQIAAKQDAKTPGSSPAAEKAPASTAQPADPKRPVKPNASDFKSWEEYETAKDKYDEDLADYKAEQRIQKLKEEMRQSAATQAMQTKLDEAKSRYGDEAEPKILDTAKTVFEDQAIAPAIKTAIGRSKVMVDALYVMGSDPDELASFVDLSIKDPLEALRKWYTVEALVQAELEKLAGKPDAGKPETNGNTPARDEDGKFLPARITKKAPAPPTELGGNSSPPGDERDRAAATGNVRAFFNDANRRDMARWKGQT